MTQNEEIIEFLKIREHIWKEWNYAIIGIHPESDSIWIEVLCNEQDLIKTIKLHLPEIDSGNGNYVGWDLKDNSEI